jgi:polar amino acid transport system permease protein
MDVFLNQYFNLDVMRQSFPDLLQGFVITLELALVSGVLSLAWGLVLSLLRQLPGRPAAPVRALAIAYIDAFRGVPLLLVILVIAASLGALAANDVLPREIGIPQWFGLPDPFWYGVFAITLTYGAYMAEVYRAGIEAVPRGQTEAARSLGMTNAQSLRFVIVPQAVRKVVPPLLNDFIALMKDTALVGVIALPEIVQRAGDIQAETFNASAFTLAALFFLVVTIPLARVVDRQIARQNIRFQRG